MTYISLTFRIKALLNESDDLTSLDTPHHSFPSQHHRDGKSVCYIESIYNGCYTVRVKSSASRAIIAELPSHQSTLTNSRSANRESRTVNSNREFRASVYIQNILWNKYLLLNISEYSFCTYHDIPPCCIHHFHLTLVAKITS